ncbi:hypothetical protein LX36DRAFT_163325 [Colletotrichum falcatum]|nr:hypothetical protein LX36DRAFT_163325 [Colletotrichum falcatum]
MPNNVGTAVPGLAPPSVALGEPESPGEERRLRHVHVPVHRKYGGAFSWPPRFFDRRQGGFSRSWENSPYIGLLLDARELAENDISFFLGTEQNWAPDQHRIDCVLDVTCEATIQKLLDRDESAQQEKIALLIDGNLSGPEPHLRGFLGGLTAQALFDELSKKRYGEDGDAGVVDADRRLIYVANLDGWGIMALVGTSSESLFRVLGDFILNYICATPSIGVSFPTEGPQTFVMQFSLPFRVWRSTAHLMNDTRKSPVTGTTLRLSRDVTFLRDLAGSKEKPVISDGIYATNISCIVTGYDQSRWTGLVFLETWFDEVLDDPSPDMVTRYVNDHSDGLLLDPLCRGKEDAIKSEWSPRPYFIRILAVRLFQVRQEWASLFYHLTQRMVALVRRHEDFIRRVRTHTMDQVPSLPTQREILEDFDELENCFRRFKEVWSELAQVLQENVRSGESFMKTDVQYFCNYDEPSDDAATCFPYLAQIRQTFKELEQLRQRAGDMQRKCKEIVEEVASVRKLHRQQSNVVTPVDYSPRVLAETTILTSPVIITAALFSCDDTLTFKSNWKSFMAMLLVVTVVLFAIVPVLWRHAAGLWPFQSQKTLEDGIKRACNPLGALDSGDGPATEQGAQAVPRRATIFTGVIDAFQNFGVRTAIAENPQIRGNIIALEARNSSR